MLLPGHPGGINWYEWQFCTLHTNHSGHSEVLKISNMWHGFEILYRLADLCHICLCHRYQTMTDRHRVTDSQMMMDSCKVTDQTLLGLLLLFRRQGTAFRRQGTAGRRSSSLPRRPWPCPGVGLGREHARPRSGDPRPNRGGSPGSVPGTDKLSH